MFLPDLTTQTRYPDAGREGNGCQVAALNFKLSHAKPLSEDLHSQGSIPDPHPLLSIKLPLEQCVSEGGPRTGKSCREFYKLHRLRPTALGKRTPRLESPSCRRASTEASHYSAALSAPRSPAKAPGTAPSQVSPKAARPKLALRTAEAKSPRKRRPLSSVPQNSLCFEGRACRAQRPS